MVWIPIRIASPILIDTRNNDVVMDILTIMAKKTPVIWCTVKRIITLCNPLSCWPTFQNFSGSPVFKARRRPYPKIQLPRLDDRLDFLFFNFAIALGMGFTLKNGIDFRGKLFTSRSIRRKIVYCGIVFLCI